MSRRSLFFSILFFTLLAVLCPATMVLAGYPEKPIKIIVPTNTGGAMDTVAQIFPT